MYKLDEFHLFVKFDFDVLQDLNGLPAIKWKIGLDVIEISIYSFNINTQSHHELLNVSLFLLQLSSIFRLLLFLLVITSLSLFILLFQFV